MKFGIVPHKKKRLSPDSFNELKIIAFFNNKISLLKEYGG